MPPTQPQISPSFLALTAPVGIASLCRMRMGLCIMMWTGALLGIGGCDRAPLDSDPTLGNVKIGDLGPRTGNPPQAKLLGTVNFEVYALDLPAENLDELSAVWKVLSAKPIRTNSYTAFRENGFRVRYGRLRMWQRVQNLLAEAGAQGAGTTSLLVSEDAPADLPIADVPAARPISFVGTDLSKQIANVTAGVLSLRLRAEPVPGARGVRKIIAYPVHSLPVSIGIPQLDATTRQREFYFASAAFATQMSPGDLVLLAPDHYTGERDSLGGTFFIRPVGAIFADPSRRKPPERKPTVRIFVLICTRVSE